MVNCVDVDVRNLTLSLMVYGNIPSFWRMISQHVSNDQIHL